MDQEAIPAKGLGFLLIGGAARSGTTLMMRLLDGHPSLLVLPMEASVSQRYVPKRDEPRADLEKYFETRFIEDRSTGQQTVMASEELFKAYNERITTEFGIPFDMDIDHEAFRRAYAESFAEPKPLPERVLRALMEAYIAGKSVPQEAVDKVRHFVVKEPFYTEVFARTMAQDLPEARYLHMVRDPFARYASSKTRRIHYGGGVCRRVNKTPIPIGIAELSIASLHSGLENLEEIGDDRYRLVRFRDMVQDTQRTMDGVAEWLGVSVSPRLYVPTVQGKAMVSMSSFSNKSGLDATALKRMSKYEELTSTAERQAHGHLISISRYGELFDIPATSLRGYTLRWFLPFKKERLRDYVWRLAGMRGLFVRSRPAIDELGSRLPELALRRGYVDKM